MKVIKTIKDKILFAYQLVAAITLVVLIAAAAIQVVTRYVIAQPPGWTDELARFAFVWCSALGAVVALDKGMHAGITLLEEKLPEAWMPSRPNKNSPTKLPRIPSTMLRPVEVWVPMKRLAM